MEGVRTPTPISPHCLKITQRVLHRGGAPDPQGMASDAVGILPDANGADPQVLLQQLTRKRPPTFEPEEGKMPVPTCEPFGEVLTELSYCLDRAADTARLVLVAHAAKAELVRLTRSYHQDEFFSIFETTALVVFPQLQVFSPQRPIFAPWHRQKLG